MRRLMLGVCVILGAWAVPLAARAFEIAPAIQELSLRAGMSANREIQLSNTNDEPVELFFTVQKFRSGGGGSPAFLPPDDTSGLPQWIRVSEPVVRLAPRSTGVVRVRIDAPKTAAPGSYTAAIFATERTKDGVTVEVAKRIATLWFVTVQGVDGFEPKPVWHIDDLNIISRARGWHTETEVGFRVKNDGDVHGIVEVNVLAEGVVFASTSTSWLARLLPVESREGRVTFFSVAPVDRMHIAVSLPTGERIERYIWVVQRRSAGAIILLVVSLLIAGQWRKRRGRGIIST